MTRYEVIMNDRSRTKKQLMEEIAGLRQRLDDYHEQVSGFRQTEEALKKSDTFYRTFFENTGTATIIIEEDTTVSMLNVEFEMVTGYTKEEIVGSSWTRYVAKEDVGRLLQYHVARRNDPGSAPRNYEFRIVTKHGDHKDIFMTIAVIPGTKLTVASMLDITERKQLEKEILNISERERQKIGQELHDDLGQHLVGIEVMTKVLKKNLQKTSAEDARYADEINALVKESIRKTRRLARGLCPVHLVANGFEHALNELASSVTEIFGVTCTFTCPSPVSVRDNTRATHLYYIAKEATHNSIEHGRATRIDIELKEEKGVVRMDVRDNGTGIPVNSISTGMGLRIMNYRARMIGASLRVHRQDKGGTVVSCYFDANSGYYPPEPEALS
ncbi:PAS domain-containing sensor histidine kinase [archaeon]|nr:PAS domain-containing sensor histidine kinase [archaeon]